MRPWKWEFRRAMSVLVNHCFAQNYLKLVKHFAHLSENGVVDFYWDANEARKTSKRLVAFVLARPDFFPGHALELEKRADALSHCAASLKRDWRADSRRQADAPVARTHATSERGPVAVGGLAGRLFQAFRSVKFCRLRISVSSQAARPCAGHAGPGAGPRCFRPRRGR